MSKCQHSNRGYVCNELGYLRDIAALEARCATLTAEVMHYTAGTPHPLEAQCREQAEVLDIIAGDMEQCVGSDNYSLGIVSGDFYRRIVGASASETDGKS